MEKENEKWKSGKTEKRKSGKKEKRKSGKKIVDCILDNRCNDVMGFDLILLSIIFVVVHFRHAAQNNSDPGERKKLSWV